MEPSSADTGARLHDAHVIADREERAVSQVKIVKDGLRSPWKLPVDAAKRLANQRDGVSARASSLSSASCPSWNAVALETVGVVPKSFQEVITVPS